MIRATRLPTTARPLGAAGRAPGRAIGAPDSAWISSIFSPSSASASSRREGMTFWTLVEGGPGDLEELARLGDVAILGLLRLDERVHAHRVSLAKKATARFRMSTLLAQPRGSPCAAGPVSARSSVVRPGTAALRRCRPASPTIRTAVSVRSKSRATWPIGDHRAAHQLDDLSLELGGERPTRTRLLLRSIVSILDILSGAAHPDLVDVRQTRRSPEAISTTPTCSRSLPASG